MAGLVSNTGGKSRTRTELPMFPSADTLYGLTLAATNPSTLMRFYLVLQAEQQEEVLD